MTYQALKKAAKPFEILTPSYGLDFSKANTEVPASATQDCSNVWFLWGEVTKRRRLATFADALDTIPWYMTDVPFNDGQKYFICCTLRSFYYLNDAATAWTQETANCFNGEFDDAFNTDMAPIVDGTDEGLLITNGIDPVKYWTGPGNAVTTLTGGTAYQIGDYHIAKDVVSFANHVLLLNTTEEDANQPNRIRWCDVGCGSGLHLEATWDSSTSLASFIDLIEQADAIRRGVLLGTELVILRDHSIFRGGYVGGNSVFQFMPAVTGIGVRAPRTVQLVQPPGKSPYLLFLGWDDVYAYQGADIVHPMSSPKITSQLFADADEPFVSQAHAVLVPSRHLYLLFMPSSQNDFDTMWAFNYEENTWSKGTMEATCASGFRTMGFPSIDELEGTIDEQHWRLDAEAVPLESATMLVGTTSSTVREMDFTAEGTAETTHEGYWKTKEVSVGESGNRSLTGRVKEIDFEAKGDFVDISFSLDKGYSWSAYQRYSLNSTYYRTYRLRVNRRARTIIVRFQNTTAGKTFSIRRAAVWVIQKGKLE